jgi:hypothetical protein
VTPACTNVLAATPNETAASGLFGNPLVGGSSLARPTDEYHVTGASPGLNRVFRLLPQGLRSAASVAEPTDLPRVRCVGRGLDSTPATVLNRSGTPRSVLPGGRAVVRLA